MGTMSAGTGRHQFVTSACRCCSSLARDGCGDQEFNAAEGVIHGNGFRAEQIIHGEHVSAEDAEDAEDLVYLWLLVLAAILPQ